MGSPTTCELCGRACDRELCAGCLRPVCSACDETHPRGPAHWHPLQHVRPFWGGGDCALSERLRNTGYSSAAGVPIPPRAELAPLVAGDVGAGLLLGILAAVVLAFVAGAAAVRLFA